MKQIKKLNDVRFAMDKRQKLSVTEKKQKLRNYQQSQVSKVIDELRLQEANPNYEWTLVQMDQKFKPVSKNQKETTVIEAHRRYLQHEENPDRGPHPSSWLPKSLLAEYKNRRDVISYYDASVL